MIKRYTEADVQRELAANPKLEFTWVKQREVELLEDKMVALEKVARFVNTYSDLIGTAVERHSLQWVDIKLSVHEILYGEPQRKRG